jgi:hypothetical protein
MTVTNDPGYYNIPEPEDEEETFWCAQEDAFDDDY